ncbi:hypothetical protein [Pedobacter namyangjuensis]|uniref:hypothetical protein n=1 Tax=Pedobacter namyangjuensis TaxID=600626 RepID=UPI000DE1E781|nr:hypothetical protein [Pedobacter namyangjuensis]
MNLVLEKKFLEDLFEDPNNDCEIAKDLQQFLMKDCNGYNLICDIDSLDEYKQLCIDNPAFESLMDKFISISFKKNLLSEDNILANSTRTIFFTTLEKKQSKILTEKYGQIFISNKDLKSSWASPLNMRKGNEFMVTQSSLISDENKIDRWDKFARFSHTFKNAIIFDKFLLKNISPNEVGLSCIPLIKNLLNTRKSNQKVNLTLISEIKVGYKLGDYIEKISQYLDSDITINIIRHLKALYPRDLEGFHARFIVTDYMKINSDNSFNYFKKNGQVSAVATVKSKFTFCGNNREFFEKDIADLKLYLTKVNLEPNGDEKYSDTYFPHKNNPLLT